MQPMLLHIGAHPTRIAPATQPWAKLCSRAEPGPCGTARRCYTPHMGAYAKCACFRIDLQTFNRLTVPPYTICCTTLQKLGVREHPCTLRSSKSIQRTTDMRKPLGTILFMHWALTHHPSRDTQQLHRHCHTEIKKLKETYKAVGRNSEAKQPPPMCYHFSRGRLATSPVRKRKRRTDFILLFLRREVVHWFMVQCPG